MISNIDETARQNVKTWLEGNYDETTKQAIRDMMDNNPEELSESFYRNLEFGTGGLRVWCLTALGPFWNTKIIILPGANVVKKGPYVWMRHPNYAVVCTEILLLPLMFQAYFTAVIFTLLNIAMLRVRIPMEENALREETNYSVKF